MTRASDQSRDERIEHYVVLMLENRSFDHMLGALARRGLIAADGGTDEMFNVGLNGNRVGLTRAVAQVWP
jgi:phospholipase C